MKRLLLLVSVPMLVARPAVAQDIEAMAKWTSYQIVHYKIVGEFAGETTLLTGSSKTAHDKMTARVTDRIELEFDWDQQEFKVVGKPVIRNFPTKVVSINLEVQLGDGNKVFTLKCPEPKLSGALEFVTGLGFKQDEAMQMSGAVLLEARRDQPGGSLPTFFPSDDERGHQQKAACGQFWDTANPVTETLHLPVAVIPGMYLAMPGIEKGMNISADKKSIISKPPTNPGASGYGWTWTITPTGVK